MITDFDFDRSSRNERRGAIMKHVDATAALMMLGAMVQMCQCMEQLIAEPIPGDGEEVVSGILDSLRSAQLQHDLGGLLRATESAVDARVLAQDCNSLATGERTESCDPERGNIEAGSHVAPGDESPASVLLS